MRFSVTFRHMDPSEPVKEYALDKLRKIKKYFPDPIQAHVVLETERHLNHADVNITLHNGIMLQSREATEDMYSSIDLVMAKLERQARRYKDKIRSHKPALIPPLSVEHRVVAAGSVDAPRGGPAEPARPRIIKQSQFTAKPMTVDEAIMQMNLIENDFLVFQDASTKDINVVYRRRDGDYGLIETRSRPADA